MRKLREVLRLRFELHLGYQQIGRSCAIGVSTVCKYLQRAEAAGVTWPLPEGWDDARIEAVLFPRTAAPAKQQTAARSQPDFASIHRQLRQHRHLTLQLLWEEYRQVSPDGYRYSRYVAVAFMLRDHLKAMTDQRRRDVHAT
jgi:transposase